MTSALPANILSDILLEIRQDTIDFAEYVQDNPDPREELSRRMMMVTAIFSATIRIESIEPRQLHRTRWQKNAMS